MRILMENLFKFFRIKFEFGDISMSFFDIFMIAFMLKLVMWLITLDWNWGTLESNSDYKINSNVSKEHYIVDKNTGEILNP